MPNPTFLGLVKFGAGNGCACGGPLQGWRKIRAWKGQHGWPLLGLAEFGAYLRQEVSGEGAGSFVATRVIDRQTGLSSGAPFVWIPGDEPRFPADGNFLLESEGNAYPIARITDEGTYQRTGRISISDQYTFSDLKGDLETILNSLEASPLVHPAGSVTMVARSEADEGIGRALVVSGSTSAVFFAPRGRFLGNRECRTRMFEVTVPGPPAKPSGAIYTRAGGTEWDIESQNTATRTYKLRTTYLRGGDGRQGSYSKERGFLSFSGFLSVRDVLTWGGFQETTLIDTGKVYFRNVGPYMDIPSPDIPDSLERGLPMHFIRTIKLGDNPPGGIGYQESGWSRGGTAGC